MQKKEAKKRLLIKMVTSVVIVVANLFQKQVEKDEEEYVAHEDDYMF